MSETYILHDGVPVIESDPVAWGRWFRDHRSERMLDRDVLGGPDGEIVVSTIFLGLDHSFGQGPPRLWETMVFGRGSPWDDTQVRYATEAEALAGHQQLVAKVRASLEGNGSGDEPTPETDGDLVSRVGMEQNTS